MLRDAIAVILQRDVAARLAAVGGHLPEDALLLSCQPVRAAELVLDDLDPVQPVLDVRAAGDDARLVPRAGRMRDV
jgi:hypothetical protein